MRSIFIRVDGNRELGFGHVYRCLALAEYLKEDFDVIFLTQQFNQLAIELIKEYGFKVSEISASSEEEDVSNSLDILRKKQNAHFFIIDGYGFSSQYHLKIRLAGYKTACVDGICNSHFFSDLVINPNLIASVKGYSKESYTRLVLGVDYSLLRLPFLNAMKGVTDTLSEKKPPFKLLVTFGGSDQFNLSQHIIQVLLSRGKSFDINIDRVYVLLGKGYSSKLEFNSPRVEVLKDLNAIELVDLLKEIDIAVCPGSSTLNELFVFRIPVLTGFYVDNQKEFSAYVDRKQYGISIGDFRTLSSDSFWSSLELLFRDFKKFSRNLSGLFDGKARERYLNLFAYKSVKDQFFFNLARLTAPKGYIWEVIGDKHTPWILQWRNNPANSGFYAKHRVVTEAEQVDFLNRYEGFDRIDLVLVHEIKDTPIGVFSIKNFETQPEHGRIIGDKENRGLGLGKSATVCILDYWFNVLGMRFMLAQTRTSNNINISLNLKLGYEVGTVVEINGDSYVQMLLKKERFNKLWKS